METIATILPVFCLMAVGYAVGRFGLLSERASAGLEEFVYVIAMPALIIRSLTGSTAPIVAPWAYWACYFGGVALTWALAALLVRMLSAGDARLAVVSGISATFSNTILMGIPLIFTVFGEPAAVPLFLLLSVHLPLMMLAGTVLMESSGGPEGPRRAVLRTTILGLVKNPLIIGIAIGGAWKLTGLPLPGLAGSVIRMLGDAASPAALFAMGMTLNRYGLLGDPKTAVIITALKLIVLPLLVFLLATAVFDLPPLWASVATTFAALPTGVNAYLFATRYAVGVAATSSAIALSTIGAAITATAWVAFVR
jgi:malonate transporter and related proteins